MSVGLHGLEQAHGRPTASQPLQTADPATERGWGSGPTAQDPEAR